MKKVYIKNTKETSLFYGAEVGFRKMGYEIIHYETVPEDITRDDILIGYIGNVHRALRYLNIEVPQAIDYPEELSWYFSREIKRIETVDEIQINSFVKPVNFKEFPGRVEKEFRDLIGITDTPMYTSQIINIETEYAVYVINGEIAGVKHYKGDPYTPLNKRVVDECIEKYKSCPASYRIDFGVTDLSQTIVIEVNDGYSSGNYGLNEITYAKFLLARWEELMQELKGDHGSIAEELFSKVTITEEKYLAVEESVEEQYFTLDEAIEAHGVNRTEYLNWREKQ